MAGNAKSRKAQSNNRKKRKQRGGKGGPRGRRRSEMYVKMPDPVPDRDYDPCPVCGGEIKDPFTAIAHGRTRRPAHLECIVEELSETENVGTDQRIAYIGRGRFGVIDKEPVVEEGKKRLSIRRIIEYESDSEHEQQPPWRKELSPGISRDYSPEPEPLSELDQKEKPSLRESLGTNRDAIYMPRVR